MTSTSPPDLLFIQATVITGEEDAIPFISDVWIKDGFIHEVARKISAPDATQIDARGHFLSPGFIDMHAHSDLYLLSNPEHHAKISQGCTVRLRCLFADM